jgi:hypothetical protein
MNDSEYRVEKYFPQLPNNNRGNRNNFMITDNIICDNDDDDDGDDDDKGRFIQFSLSRSVITLIIRAINR